LEIIKTEHLKNTMCETSVAIGFFDGIHLAHQKVINNAIRLAKNNNIKSVVITFDESPKMALGHSDFKNYITPFDEKMSILKEIGVDYAFVLTTDETLLNLSAKDFIKEYLLTLNAKYVSVGFDFKFGKNGQGDISTLKQCNSFSTEVICALDIDDTKVSSSFIKEQLARGNLFLVNKFLGRNFFITATVVKGKQLGRTIGYPTANLILKGGSIFGLLGVFATKIYIDGVMYPSMTNIGFNPTVSDEFKILVETHIFDFSEEIYGKVVRLEFIDKIRDEIKFSDLFELTTQLDNDKKNARKILN